VAKNKGYLKKELCKLEEFRNIIRDCDFKPFQRTFNDAWFEKISTDLYLCITGRREGLSGQYAAYRWLHEDAHFDNIIENLKVLYANPQFKTTIRNKISRLVAPKWKDIVSNAFELALICRFSVDDKLLDIDALINPEKNGSNADAKILIRDRNIFIEATAFTNTEIKTRVGVIDIQKNINRAC